MTLEQQIASSKAKVELKRQGWKSKLEKKKLALRKKQLQSKWKYKGGALI